MSSRRTLAAVLALTAVVVALGAAGATGAVRTPLSGWLWGNPTPQGGALTAIDFIGDRGYAIGDGGTALRSDDAGTTWAGLATGTSAQLVRQQVIDADSVVALGGDGCVLRRSDDGGTTFDRIYTVQERGCPDPIAAFWFVDETTGYLVLTDGSVLRTTDKGQTFSKQTAVPGTAASATGGNGRVVDIVFPEPGRGIVVLAGGPPITAYDTTDAGVSWKPLAVAPPGNVTRLYRFDAATLWAIGPQTLLRSTDGGLTFTPRAAGAGHTLTGVRCASADLCLLTTDKGELLRTTDGGDSATAITAASVPLAAAAFVSPTRAIAVGTAGQMVVSSDAGVNWVPLGTDVGGSYARLRLGAAPTSVYAAGAKGQIALSTDGGALWKSVFVTTSADLLDTSWSSATTGYAIDVRGSLFRTQNAGTSWQTLSPGSGGTAGAVLALTDNSTVLLAGPRGIRRSKGGGPFDGVAGKTVSRAALGELAPAGAAVLAWGRGGKALLVSTTKGASWKAVRLPSKKTRVADVSFVSAGTGWLLDTSGRLWSTRNGGRRWSESLAIGASDGVDVAFGSASSGFLSIRAYGSGAKGAYVLRTSDGGRTWRPQAIQSGLVSDLVAADAQRAYALVDAFRSDAPRWMFATTTGGDAGSASSLKIKAKPGSFTKKALKKAKGRVTISGTLPGARGGEEVVVSARARKGGAWSHRTAVAGANGGAFSAQFTIKSSSVVVAQWRGDSGRRGVGTPPLSVNVR